MLPNPLIFGVKRPQLRLKLVGDTQYVYSTSNQDLFTSKADFSDDGTYPLSSLLSGRRRIDYHGLPAFQTCSRVCDDDICPMIIERVEHTPASELGLTVEATQLTRPIIRKRPDFEKCPMISSLLECTTPPAEKRFAQAYYDCAIAGVSHNPKTPIITILESDPPLHHSDLNVVYGSVVKDWQRRQLNLKKWHPPIGALQVAIMRSFVAPALIPQVWLNWTYDPMRPPQDEEKDLKDMPKRVDFVFFEKGELHVIEIDDPSHYARYDEVKRKYEVDERQYTKNLRTERALRSQGFFIHRISNLEILEASESELIDVISSAIGFDLRSYEPLPRIEDYNDEPRPTI